MMLNETIYLVLYAEQIFNVEIQPIKVSKYMNFFANTLSYYFVYPVSDYRFSRLTIYLKIEKHFY